MLFVILSQKSRFDWGRGICDIFFSPCDVFCCPVQLQLPAIFDAMMWQCATFSRHNCRSLSPAQIRALVSLAFVVYAGRCHNSHIGTDFFALRFLQIFFTRRWASVAPNAQRIF